MRRRVHNLRNSGTHPVLLPELNMALSGQCESFEQRHLHAPCAQATLGALNTTATAVKSGVLYRLQLAYSTFCQSGAWSLEAEIRAALC